MGTRDEEHIRSADAVIPLLSADSIYSEMLGFEIESAHEAAQLHQGKPFVCVRVKYTGPLPEPLSSILDPLQYFLWEGDHDDLGLITELGEALKQAPESLEQPAAAPTPAQLPGQSPADRTCQRGSTSLSPRIARRGGSAGSEFYQPHRRRRVALGHYQARQYRAA